VALTSKLNKYKETKKPDKAIISRFIRNLYLILFTLLFCEFFGKVVSKKVVFETLFNNLNIDFDIFFFGAAEQKVFSQIPAASFNFRDFIEQFAERQIRVIHFIRHYSKQVSRQRTTIAEVNFIFCQKFFNLGQSINIVSYYTDRQPFLLGEFPIFY